MILISCENKQNSLLNERRILLGSKLFSTLVGGDATELGRVRKKERREDDDENVFFEENEEEGENEDQRMAENCKLELSTISLAGSTVTFSKSGLPKGKEEMV